MRRWKNVTKVVLYEEQNDIHLVRRSVKLSGLGVTNPDELQFRLHSVELNCGSGSGLIVMIAVNIQKVSYTIPYSYQFHCTSLYGIPETLRDVSKYVLYIWTP